MSSSNIKDSIESLLWMPSLLNPNTSLYKSSNYSYVISEDGSSSNTIFFNSKTSKSNLDLAELEQIFELYRKMGIDPRLTIIGDSNDTESVIKSLNVSKKYVVLKCYDAMSMSLFLDPKIELFGSPMTHGLEIVRVSASNLHDYLSVMGEVWGFDKDELKNFSVQVQWGIDRYPQEYIPLIGYVDNKPVATSGLILQSAPILVSSCVHPKFRRQGVYKSLIKYRAKMAIDAGFKNIYVNAKVLTSAPICAYIGFKKDFHIQVLELSGVNP